MCISCSLLLGGCYDWIAIRATELPKLNGSTRQELGRVQNATIVAVTTTPVMLEDGRLHEVEGRFDLRLTTDEQVYSVSAPVLSEVMSGQLFVRGGNVRPFAVNLRSIQRTEVSQYNSTLTIAVTLVSVLFVGAFAAVIGVVAF